MKEITDIYAIAMETLTTNLHVVVAYAALLLSFVFKYRYIYGLKKGADDMAEAAVATAEKLDVAIATNNKLTGERQAFLKQIKQEREMKGEYRQKYENIIRTLN